MIVKGEGFEVEVVEGAWVYVDGIMTSWEFLEPGVQDSVSKLVADIEAKTQELKALIEAAPTDQGERVSWEGIAA